MPQPPRPAWSSPLVLFLAGQAITSGATYAAIRADLREALVTAHAAEAKADKAHDRIDRITDRAR